MREYYCRVGTCQTCNKNKYHFFCRPTVVGALLLVVAQHQKEIEAPNINQSTMLN